MKKITKILMMASAFALCATADLRAQISQFSQPTVLTVTTNSGVIASTPFQINVPALQLIITSTNSTTIITNTMNDTISVLGQNLTEQTTFIYNAATMGTNFTTNFAPYQILGTNYAFGQASPQGGGTNIVSIK